MIGITPGTSVLPALLLTLLMLAACSQSAFSTAPQPTALPSTEPLPATGTPLATPFPTEGIAGSNSLAYDLGEATITQPEPVTCRRP